MTHAPLTPPVPIPPSIYGSEALVIWMLSTAMKAPMSEPPTAIQVFPETGASATSAMTRIDGRLDRHARAQAAKQRVMLVNGDFHWNPLNDLDEVAGGVVGRKQGKLLATGRC